MKTRLRRQKPKTISEVCGLPNGSFAKFLEEEDKKLCPKCGTSGQIWENQITGKMTCHRLNCHIVVEGGK